MELLALYRKYRPADFSEVIGQEHIVRVLAGALKSGKIAHAFLFAGSRGTGKTSVARIFARAVGCQPTDLYEIDAASNRGIDEIRELREAVRTYPFESPFKVYIIDEAHMLTKEAFNALLKTLEEPPNHVIFILATTESHRLPETIVSRCQTFNFKKPGQAEIKKLVLSVARQEKVEIEPAAAELIALLAEGSFRDGVGILQKAISISADRRIVPAEIEAVTGAPPAKLVAEFLLALLDRRLVDGLRILKELGDQNYDVRIFLKLVLRSLRLALLLSIASEFADEFVVGLNVEEVERIEKIKCHPRVGELPRILRRLLAVYDEIRFAYLPVLPLELAAAELSTDAA